MDGLDICPWQKRHLVLQMDIFGRFLQLLRNRHANPLPHFGCRRIRKRHHKQSIYFLFLPQKLRDNALHENRRFAAACRRRNQQIAAPRINRLFLLLRPSVCHRRSSPHCPLGLLRPFQADVKGNIARKGAHKTTIGIIPEIPDECEGKTTQGFVTE